MSNKEQSIGKGRLTIIMLVLGACWAVLYLVPFLQYTWYSPFKEFIGGTNMQLGLLITIYGFGNVFGAPIGGWFADRFNYKYIYVMSVLLNGVFSLIFLMKPCFEFAVLIWIGFAFSSLFLNYPTHIKIVRNLATEESQGTIFGFNETSIGIFNIVISSSMMFAFTRVGEGVGGIRAAIVTNAVISFVLTALAIIFIPNPAKTGELDRNKELMASDEGTNFFKDFGKVCKNQATWLVAVSIFAVYSTMTTLTYFTPYFTDVLKTGVAFSGWVAIARQYGTQILGAPVGGIVTDKKESSAKVLIGVYIVSIIGFIWVLKLKPGTSLMILITLLMIMSFATYMGRGSYYATISETGVSRELTASTIGVAAAVGFSPDLFQFTLFGYWLDKFGNRAYTFMFIYGIIVCIIGMAAALQILRMKKNLS